MVFLLPNLLLWKSSIFLQDDDELYNCFATSKKRDVHCCVTTFFNFRVSWTKSLQRAMWPRTYYSKQGWIQKEWIDIRVVVQIVKRITFVVVSIMAVGTLRWTHLEWQTQSYLLMGFSVLMEFGWHVVENAMPWLAIFIPTPQAFMMFPFLLVPEMSPYHSSIWHKSFSP